MNPKERRENFYKRWNIKLWNYSEVDELSNLKTRILNLFEDNLWDELDFPSFFKMCQIFNIKMRDKDIHVYSAPYEHRTSRAVLTEYFMKISNPIEMYYFLEEYMAQNFTYTHSKIRYIKDIKEILEMSFLPVRVIEDRDSILFYPKWEEILDENLVNWPLSFLSDDINQKFQNALNFYLQKNYIKSCEECRRALEEFLREKLWNTKWLAENIKELSKELKINDSITDMRNITFQNFNFIDKYFNENSKHNDGDLQDFDNEFVIYQTGLLMRYIENFFQK